MMLLPSFIKKDVAAPSNQTTKLPSQVGTTQPGSPTTIYNLWTWLTWDACCFLYQQM